MFSFQRRIVFNLFLNSTDKKMKVKVSTRKSFLFVCLDENFILKIKKNHKKNGLISDRFNIFNRILSYSVEIRSFGTLFFIFYLLFSARLTQQLLQDLQSHQHLNASAKREQAVLTPSKSARLPEQLSFL